MVVRNLMIVSLARIIVPLIYLSSSSSDWRISGGGIPFYVMHFILRLDMLILERNIGVFSKLFL